MTGGKPDVGVLSTFGADFLASLIDVQSRLAGKIHVVAPALARCPDNVHLYPIKYKVGDGLFAQISNQIIAQLRMSYNVAKLSKKVDFWIFAGCDVFVLPALTVRFSGLRIMLVFMGNLEREVVLKKHLLAPLLRILKRINGYIAYRIIVPSDNLISQWSLHRHRDKTIVAMGWFVNLDSFMMTRPLSLRAKSIGYVGRLSYEKGILNFIDAIPAVLKSEPDARFVIIGDGPLLPVVRERINRANLSDNVALLGAISHDDIPKQLNELSLFVLPSYTEGMPSALLEAMACGTPVLATPVGGVPDVVIDGQTGFLVEDNHPGSLALGIRRVLHCPHLNEIVHSARRLIETDFSLRAIQEKYRIVMAEGSANLPVRVNNRRGLNETAR